MTILYADPIFLEHDTGPGHPESPRRLQAVYEHLERGGLGARFAPGPIHPVTTERLVRIHEPDYIDRIRRTSDGGGGRLDPDTVVSERSYEVALHAAGAAVDAVEQVVGARPPSEGGSQGAGHRADSHSDPSQSPSHKGGGDTAAVCLIRPPGHHALRNRAMGFCLFNNIALAAEHARQAHGLARILIVDWDVHHGNGTQDVFYEDPEVYFFSAHRYPFYPGTGAAEERGRGPGEGMTFNLPLPFGISRREYRERFAEMLEEAAERCRPELVLISAGFDAHAADPIGSLGLETEDFGELTQMVLDAAERYGSRSQESGDRDQRPRVAPRGIPIISLLEGGYNVDALAESVACHLETLLAAE